MQDQYIVDVWGGEQGSVHVARSLLSLKAAMPLLKREIEQGFIVSIARVTEGISTVPFDHRQHANSYGLAFICIN